MFSKSQHCQDWPLFILQRRRGEPKRHFISLAEIHGNLGWGNSQGSTKYVLFNIWMFNNWKGKAPKFKLWRTTSLNMVYYTVYIYISYTYMYVSTSLHNFSQLVKVFLCLTELKNLVITFKSQILFCQHIKSGGGVGSS